MKRKASNKKKNRLTGARRAVHKLGTRQLALISVIIVAVSVCAAGGGIWWAFSMEKRMSQTAQVETAQTVEMQTEERIQPAETEDAERETETLPEEPEILVELTDANREGFVHVESCEVRAGSDWFELKANVDEKPVSDDDNFYLFEMKMYDTELNQEGDYIDSVSKAKEFTLKASVNENKADSRLYSKFVVAVKLNGEYVALCEPQYITNPEALAAYTAAFPTTSSIKGILVDPLKLTGGELDDLGVKHAAYNIPISNILGETTNGNYPTIHYTYNGKNYAFNGQRIAEYDHVFSILTQKGITISAILLNNKSSAQPQLIHPLSRDGSAHYYAFNTAEEDGIQTMAAVGAFLAKRYRDSEHGTVMNWIVGNEVNVRTDWNYMQQVDLETYSREYANAVRVFYNSIKSMNANARIYVSMDQQWDRNISNNRNYDVKDMLETINRIVTAEGNIDWGLAHHPYAYPLENTTFWNSSSKIRNLVLDTEDTSIVTMENIDVITDFLQRPEMLTADGEVRPVILSELGYSSAKGETNQAAAIAYAYYAASNNPYIDALILSRQTDAAEEVAQGLALGLSYQGGQHKYAYEVYKNIDGPGSESYTEFAKSIIGISSWSEVTGG
ncbi:MAG: DUF5722 domain-containing protein [Eubacteriales bacterium]|nr:DUF5722 domain-containing protein [Eubacteriales bacterium]